MNSVHVLILVAGYERSAEERSERSENDSKLKR